jgi:peptidoglycan/LPS O-acetylase OafA/YrhL
MMGIKLAAKPLLCPGGNDSGTLYFVWCLNTVSFFDRLLKFRNNSVVPEVAGQHLRYRPEIDGLRAVAVIPVIFFHAGFGPFSGGFVGVDIFFVISGYLITSIILREKEEGTFSIRAFYERRVRRILPALYLVTLCCIPFALIWMAPEQRSAFGKSVVAVALFVSNVLFWSETGYFTPAADEKPLLHTWSLGIEEQYYIVFPVLILLLWRFGLRAIAVVVFLSIIPSFLFARIGSYRWPEAAFYLIFSRSWELAVGALAAIYMLNPIAVARPVRELLGILGLGLICYGIFFYSAKTPYPGVYTLAPTVGALLIIVFANSHTAVAKVLSIGLLVGVGLISYSAYLWHQPVLAFYRVVHNDSPPVGVLLVLISLCFVLAYLTWRFVERPARYKLSKPSLAIGAVFASVLVIGAGILTASGQVGRTFSPVQMAQMSPANGNSSFKSENCLLAIDSAYGFRGCSRYPDLKGKAILYGDSHAVAIYSELSDALAVHGIDLILLRNKGKQRFACEQLFGSFKYGKFVQGMKEWCAERTLEVAQVATRLGAQNIFIALRYTFSLFPATGSIESLNYDNGEGGATGESYRENFVFNVEDKVSFAASDKLAATRAAFTSLIDEFKGTVTFIGPVPEVGWRVGDRNRSRILLFGEAEQTISTDYERFKVRNELANAILRNIANHEKAIVVQPSDVLCNQFIAGRCVAQIDAAPLYSDDDHLSFAGAKLLSRYVVETLKSRAVLR